MRRVVTALLIGLLLAACTSSNPATTTAPAGAGLATATTSATGTPSSPPLRPSPTPSARPTPKLTPTPTPKPTPKPTPRPTAAPATVSVSFVSLPPVSPGQYETAQVKTSPGASCSILVEYKSGPSTAAGLSPATADGSGNVSWTWKVGTRTTPGSWPVTVTCSLGASSGTATADLVVQ